MQNVEEVLKKARTAASNLNRLQEFEGHISRILAAVNTNDLQGFRRAELALLSAGFGIGVSKDLAWSLYRAYTSTYDLRMAA